MRIINCQDLVFIHRPFAGSLGASLYVGAGEVSINYRRNRILDGADSLLVITGVTNLGAASFPKSQAVGKVTSPTAAINYTLPAGLLNTEVWGQVRTFANDYENETVFRPRRLTTDGSGNPVGQILGRAKLIEAHVRDSGGMRLRFNWIPNRDGVQPATFSVVKTAGGGTVPTVTVSAVTGQREYSISVPSLSDGVTYTFALHAANGLVSATLLSGISFTAVASGPGAVTGLVIVEH